jgi:hypothetical protein
MGIHGEIIPQVEQACSLSTRPTVFMTALPGICGSTAYMEDTLTIIPYNPGQNDGMFTGLEYFEMFFRPHATELQSNSVGSVACFDDPANVAKQKEQTQKARKLAMIKAQSKRDLVKRVDKIPDHYDFNDGGVYDIGEPDSAGTPFNFNALRESSGVIKRRMWKYLLKTMSKQSIPDGRTMWFEMDHSGPWKFSGIEPGVHDPSSAHNHGEADPSMAFWLEKLCFNQAEHNTAVVRSIDADLVPILMWSIELDQRVNKSTDIIRKPIYWKRKHGSFVEMRGYTDVVRNELRLNATQYMIYCICCKTDYFHSDLVFYGFGPSKILAAIQSMVDTDDGHKANELDIFEREGADIDTAKELLAFDRLVRRVYTNHYTKSVSGMQMIVCNKNNAHLGLSKYHQVLSHGRLAELAAESQAKAAAAKKQRQQKKPTDAVVKERRTIALPSKELIALAYSQLNFNHRYWKDRKSWPAGMNGVASQQQAQPSQTDASAPAAAAASSSSSTARVMRTEEDALQIQQDVQELEDMLMEDVSEIVATADGEASCTGPSSAPYDFINRPTDKHTRSGKKRASPDTSISGTDKKSRA